MEDGVGSIGAGEEVPLQMGEVAYMKKAVTVSWACLFFLCLCFYAQTGMLDVFGSLCPLAAMK